MGNVRKCGFNNYLDCSRTDVPDIIIYSQIVPLVRRENVLLDPVSGAATWWFWCSSPESSMLSDTEILRVTRGQRVRISPKKIRVLQKNVDNQTVMRFVAGDQVEIIKGQSRGGRRRNKITQETSLRPRQRLSGAPGEPVERTYRSKFWTIQGIWLRTKWAELYQLTIMLMYMWHSSLWLSVMIAFYSIVLCTMYSDVRLAHTTALLICILFGIYTGTVGLYGATSSWFNRQWHHWKHSPRTLSTYNSSHTQRQCYIQGFAVFEP